MLDYLMKFLFKTLLMIKIPAKALKEIAKAVLYALLGWLSGDYIG